MVQHESSFFTFFLLPFTCPPSVLSHQFPATMPASLALPLQSLSLPFQPLLFAYSILFIFVFLAFCLFIGNDPKHPRSDFYSSSSVRSPVDCSNYLKRTSNICKPPLVIKLSHSLYMRICVRRCHLYLFFKFLALFY